MSDERVLEILQMIQDNMRDDAVKFEGLPFNGKTVSEYLAHLGAAVATLAEIQKTLIARSKNPLDTNEKGA